MVRGDGDLRSDEPRRSFPRSGTKQSEPVDVCVDGLDFG
jgi:hypothetical protein